MIEMFFINVQQRRAIYFLEDGDVTNDANIAVILDGAAIVNVLVADERHSAKRQARIPQRGKRQKRVIDRPQRRARRNNNWEPDPLHEIAHHVALVERHHYPPGALDDPFPPGWGFR